MVIPHFRKGQVNGEIAVLGITKSVKKKPPVSGIIYQGGSYGADDRDFKRMEAARMSAFGTKRTSRRGQPMSAFGGKADIGWRCRDVCS